MSLRGPASSSTCGSPTFAEPPVARAAPARVLVALAASAGGIEATRGILAALPSALPAAVVLVQHRTASAPWTLARILAWSTSLRVVEGTEGALLEDGTVFVAPPDRHLSIGRDRRLHLVRGPRIRHVFSSANPMLESAVIAFGPAKIAVILTGYDSDGTDGVQSVAAAGGPRRGPVDGTGPRHAAGRHPQRSGPADPLSRRGARGDRHVRERPSAARLSARVRSLSPASAPRPPRADDRGVPGWRDRPPRSTG